MIEYNHKREQQIPQKRRKKKMAYGIYYRSKGSKSSFTRAYEMVTPTRKVKFSYDGKIPRDIRCNTLKEAKEVEARYIARGLETKIKEVK